MSRYGICPYKVTTVTHSKGDVKHVNMSISNALVVVSCNLFATGWV